MVRCHEQDILIPISSLKQGREYDEIGNMRNWWNNATLVQFKFRTKCIEDQYSGYRVLGSFIYYISTWRGGGALCVEMGFYADIS